jgi:hypothetical protein
MTMEVNRFSAFDRYSRTARLKPAFLVAFPLTLMFGEWSIGISLATSLLVMPISAFGFTYLIAQCARDVGKKKEPILFALWGGKPTIAKLRHRNESINVHTRQRYHTNAVRLTGRRLPSPSAEASDAEKADLEYEICGDCLRELTRNTEQFPLLFQELINYGFRRNVWAMKPIALAVSTLCLSVQAVLMSHQYIRSGAVPPRSMAVFAVEILTLLVWIWVIDPLWVRVAADAYADRLVSSSEVLK